MNIVQRIAKNTGVLLVAQIAGKILGFFYVMHTTRYLGAEGFGILSFAIAFTGIFSVFSDLGLSTLTVREVARDKALASKYLGNILVIKMILAVFTFGLISLTINLLGYPIQTVQVVYLVTLSVIFGSFSQVFYSIFQAYEKMEYQSAGQILNSALMLSGALFAIYQRFSVISFASIYSIVSAVALGYSSVVCMWKFVRPSVEIDWKFWKQTIKEAWPLGVMAACVLIRFRIDTVMLSLMMGNVAVGLYNAAYKLLDISVVAPGIFMTAIFPILSQHYKNSINSFNITYEKSFKYLLIIALPIAFVVTLLAKPIINLIFGSGFVDSADVLQILIWAAVSMYMSMLIGNVYIAADKQKLSMKITIVSVILNVVLNLILIPRYSYMGAAATTVASEFFGLSLGIFFLNKCGHKLNITKTCFVPLLGIVGAGVSAVFLNIFGADRFIIVLLSLTVYSVIVYKIGIKEDDKQLMKNLFSLLTIKALWRRVI